ncbi:MAG: serine hydrolase [Gemmatimonadales bacterium]|jgi:CubicO group peptidase (beta-lactamase class C family)
MGVSRRRFVLDAGGALGALAVGSGTGLAAPRAATTWLPPSPRWRLPEAFIEGLPSQLAAHGVPAVSVALGGPEMPVAAVAAGARTAAPDGSARAATPDGVFAAASLSKPVVATIAWALHREGAFDVDRPVVEYLEDDIPTGRRAGEITSRHALEHASGLPNWRFEPGPLEVAFEPGTGWRYSGEGYVLVQRALETATGKALERLAREIVFRPLGMDSSSYLPRPDLAARAVPPHVAPEERFGEYAALAAWKERALMAWAEENSLDPADVTQARLRQIDPDITARASRMADRELPAAPTVPNFIVPNGAGSLRTTASDYLLLLRHWLADDRLRALAFDAPIERSDGLAWGAGWGLDGRDRTAFWHWGETLGVRTLAYADAGAGDALVVLTNGSDGMPLCEAAFQAATGGESALFEMLR